MHYHTTAATSPSPATHLVLDKSRPLVLTERRRFDCESLSVCELAWVAAHGCEQARCPADCGAFVQQPGLEPAAPLEPVVLPPTPQDARPCAWCKKNFTPEPRETPGRTPLVCSLRCKEQKADHFKKLREGRRNRKLPGFVASPRGREAGA